MIKNSSWNLHNDERTAPSRAQNAVRRRMDGLIKSIIANENHLQLIKQSGNITIFHLSYFLEIPQQPARLRTRSRMVALFKFVANKPSTPSSLGVLGFSLGNDNA
ncbi:hypothetical protein [Nitrosomonas sp.]|uniref:hypothetical protein n=1 Tax=Nitrosomonas sp. TaxID=42353 RepID=UPI0025DC8E5E|nr:hypothetical protein [Nitrosomonas sp.]